MADQVPQNFANHARFVPGYHFYLTAILLGNLVWAIVGEVRNFAYDGLANVIMAVAFIMIALYGRLFALAAQDRIIRLEETLRLQRLAPDLAARASEVGRRQWVALRFASDAEFPALVTKVLDEKITDEKAIKRMIQTWRPDYLRA